MLRGGPRSLLKSMSVATFNTHMKRRHILIVSVRYTHKNDANKNNVNGSKIYMELSINVDPQNFFINYVRMCDDISLVVKETGQGALRMKEI